MLPFYWLYRRHLKINKKPSEDFNQDIEQFFSSRYTNWLVFFWAATEALFWFVIPEFLLILLIFMRTRRKRELLFYDIYGTIAGTIVAFAIHLPERLIDKLPYIQPGMVAQVRHWYDLHGLIGLIYQPFSGVPYKVFTHLAPHYHFFIITFLIFAVLVRISRYAIIYGMLASVYPILHRFVYRNYPKLFIIGTIIFSVLLFKVYRSYGPGYQVSLVQLLFG